MKVTLVQRDGVERVLENVPPGKSLMEVARDNGVVGILADCGGSCECGTCHVYVEPQWQALVGSPDNIESATLDRVSDVKPDASRLSCQIVLREELDGLRVAVAQA
jgi:2Fe-2S ferredoxin